MTIKKSPIENLRPSFLYLDSSGKHSFLMKSKEEEIRS